MHGKYWLAATINHNRCVYIPTTCGIKHHETNWNNHKSSSPYETNVGSVAVLYCSARGKPIPTVQWYKDGFAFNPVPSLFQQVLLVPNDTEGTTVYTCVSINNAGNKIRTRFANITVIVKGT